MFDIRIRNVFETCLKHVWDCFKILWVEAISPIGYQVFVLNCFHLLDVILFLLLETYFHILDVKCVFRNRFHLLDVRLCFRTVSRIGCQSVVYRRVQILDVRGPHVYNFVTNWMTCVFETFSHIGYQVFARFCFHTLDIHFVCCFETLITYWMSNGFRNVVSHIRCQVFVKKLFWYIGCQLLFSICVSHAGCQVVFSY